MNHTEAFNAIMARNKPTKKVKQQPVTFEMIKPVENMNTLQESLSKCTIAGNVLHLPKEQLSNYNELRTALLKAGAQYKKNTFVFPNEARPYVDKLMGGEVVNLKKEFQFFATPKKIADEMAAFAMVGFDPNTMTILEPSEGHGPIVNAFLEFDFKDEMIVHGYELMDINRNVLSKIKDFVLLGEDFLTEIKPRQTFDRIIANPPFAKNQDIDHIRLMFKHLKEGGRIVTIASVHWQFASGKKETEFKAWLDEIGAVVENLDAGDFKESGTNVKTCMIIIDK